MAEVRYVQRDPVTGEVTGHFSHPHPYALEEVAEDHPDIVAWFAKLQAQREEYLRRKLEMGPEVLTARIAELESTCAALLAQNEKLSADVASIKPASP